MLYDTYVLDIVVMTSFKRDFLNEQEGLLPKKLRVSTHLSGHGHRSFQEGLEFDFFMFHLKYRVEGVRLGRTSELIYSSDKSTKG